MTHPVPPNPDELNLDARELAIAVARKAGLNLEEWTATILSNQDHRRASPAEARKPAQPETPPVRSSEPSRSPLERNFESLMAAVAAKSERQVQDQASRTAIALESMASWIEQTEERLNQTERTSADHHDRMASALSQALSTLKDRLDTVEQQAVAAEGEKQPEKTWMPVVGAIRTEIERLRTNMDALATRDEITALDQALKDIAKDMRQSPASKDMLVLAQSTAALYRQIQILSEDVNEGLHTRIVGEIDHLKSKIDRMAQAGVDRSVIDFLSSQIVDMRQDLAQRAEPRQIELLSQEVKTLSGQLSDLRSHQIGRSDFSALKSSLENVCAALNRSIAVQEASDMPARIESMSRDLASLASKPAPEAVNLEPITDHLAALTERMTGLSESRFAQHDALTEMIERLSTQVQAVADKESSSHEPLMKRFDRLDEGLREVGQQANTAAVERMLHTIDEKLDRVPLKPMNFDALERQISSLAEQLEKKSDIPLHKALDEATSHIRNLQSDAAGIAERAAKAALKDLQPSLPDTSDIDALKQGFVELKALQSRADKKTQDTLRAVQGALETLISRFPEQGSIAQSVGPISLAMADAKPEHMPPADRLEAAVRRLHAVTLSHLEEVSSAQPESITAKQAEASSKPEVPAIDEANLGTVRASFIAAARRAAQFDKVDQASPFPETETSIANEDHGDDAEAATPASLMERIRRSLDSHRRTLLLGLGFLILATGTAQVLSSGHVPSPLSWIAVEGWLPKDKPVPLTDAQPQDVPAQTGSVVPSTQKTDLFQPSSLGAGAPQTISGSAVLTTAKFLIDPATVGEIPTQIPATIRQAALTGDATALYEIAARAADGRGLPQDMSLAVRLYERAAQAGLAPAQERLAMLLEKGVGTNRDPKQAAIWYERAAQGGNVRAMHNLATLLASGANGKPDYAAAMRWYNEAAEAGLKDSQFNMGVLLARGIGTKPDIAKAYKWFALAAAQGDADAAKKRDELANRLGTAELSAARVSVEQWHPRPVDALANEAPVFPDGQTAALDRTEGNRS